MRSDWKLAGLRVTKGGEIQGQKSVSINMGVGRIFSMGGPIVDFPGVAKKSFAEGGKSGKI